MLIFSRIAVVLLALSAFAAPASARDITVASWNLGWHMDRALATEWIERCSDLFALDAQTGLWTPGAASGTVGWEVDLDKAVWDWNTYPVCNVYQANFNTVPVTVTSYDNRLTQAQSFLVSKVTADIIAFQEVSGEEAVREVLPNGGADYGVCSFSEFKVQRLAIAWKSSLGTEVSCLYEKALTIPDNDEADQPRPGLALTLMIDGEFVRILNVHLKSGCVSPLEVNSAGEHTGDLTNIDAEVKDRNCRILQQQAVPFEAWVEEQSAETDKVVLLGDFNRNFWHEEHTDEVVRTDGSDPVTALPAGVLVKDLFGEVFDEEPATSVFTLLSEECTVNAFTKTLCAEAETRAITSEERRQLSFTENLGCRNPLGLDHILIGNGFTADGNAQHVAVGEFGRTKPADSTHTDPLLAVSDHCPLIVKLEM